MGRRFTWNHHSQRGNRHAQWRSPSVPDPMERYEQYQYWRRGKSVREILEINGQDPGPLQMVYSLYRRTKRFKGYEWVYERKGYCSFKTWIKWAKGAVPLEGVS